MAHFQKTEKQGGLVTKRSPGEVITISFQIRSTPSPSRHQIRKLRRLGQRNQPSANHATLTYEADRWAYMAFLRWFSLLLLFQQHIRNPSSHIADDRHKHCQWVNMPPLVFFWREHNRRTFVGLGHEPQPTGSVISSSFNIHMTWYCSEIISGENSSFFIFINRWALYKGRSEKRKVMRE